MRANDENMVEVEGDVFEVDSARPQDFASYVILINSVILDIADKSSKSGVPRVAKALWEWQAQAARTPRPDTQRDSMKVIGFGYSGSSGGRQHGGQKSPPIKAQGSRGGMLSPKSTKSRKCMAKASFKSCPSGSGRITRSRDG